MSLNKYPFPLYRHMSHCSTADPGVDGRANQESEPLGKMTRYSISNTKDENADERPG